MDLNIRDTPKSEFYDSIMAYYNNAKSRCQYKKHTALRAFAAEDAVRNAHTMCAAAPVLPRGSETEAALRRKFLLSHRKSCAMIVALPVRGAVTLL